MANVTVLVTSLLQLVVPEPCFEEFFVKFNFINVPCLKIVISKCLGYGIIVASVIVKVPQIMKIVNARSSEGLSIISASMELTAITGSMAYGYAMAFPFSSYGETVFLVLQTGAIACLILGYSRGGTLSAVYLAVYVVILSYLMSPVVPMSVLWALQASVMPLTASARLYQAWTNYTNGTTGQLSAVTMMLLFLGSFARIFTSIQETGDRTIILTYIVASLCNAILVFQILYYWKATDSVSQRKKATLKEKKLP